MNIFINYFEHKNSLRKKEIEYCLEKNKENAFIKNIVIINRNSRCTYGDFLTAMQRYPNGVNVIANSDIYFDSTIKIADNIKPGECYALTRWEEIDGTVIDFSNRHGKPSPPEWSQDAWIFRGSINADRFFKVKAVNLNTRTSEMIPFSLGIPGCDNKFAAMLKEQGIIVTNPSQSIKAIHVHKENSRTYPAYQILAGIRPQGQVFQSKL